jgi:integrase
VRLRVAGLTGPSGGSTRGIFYEDPRLGRPWPSIACGLQAILVNALSLLRLVDVYERRPEGSGEARPFEPQHRGFGPLTPAEAPEMQCLNNQQAATLLKYAEGNRLGALYVLALSTGMRRSEILGLKWEDLDLDAGYLQVRRGLTVSPSGGVEIDDPKRFSSKRRIDPGSKTVAPPSRRTAGARQKRN